MYPDEAGGSILQAVKSDRHDVENTSAHCGQQRLCTPHTAEKDVDDCSSNLSAQHRRQCH